jgi:hypothetical protein
MTHLNGAVDDRWDQAHKSTRSAIASGSSKTATSDPEHTSRPANKCHADLRPFFDFIDSRNR